MVYGSEVTKRLSLKWLWSIQTLYIHKGPSQTKIESQRARKMHQQAGCGLTDV